MTMADVGPLVARLENQVAQLRSMQDVPTSLDARLQPVAEPSAAGTGRLDPVDAPVSGRLDPVDRPLVGRLDPVDKPVAGRLVSVEQPATRPAALLETVNAPVTTLSDPLASQAKR